MSSSKPIWTKFKDIDNDPHFKRLDNEWAIETWHFKYPNKPGKLIHKYLSHMECNTYVRYQTGKCMNCSEKAPPQFLTLLKLLNLPI